MSAQNTLLTAVRANERGAFEYLPKPFDLNELISVVDRALAETKSAMPEFTKQEAVDELPLIGRSNAMQEIYRVMARLMTTDLTSLQANQEPARNLSPGFTRLRKRKEGPFVPINMAAIPRELINELFGHERALSQVLSGAMRDDLSRQTAARFFSMRSATCRWRHRHACFASCRKANLLP